MKTIIRFILPFFFLTITFFSCSESDDDVPEFPNWKAQNDVYYQELTDSVEAIIATAKAQYGDKWKDHCDWRMILSTTLDANSAFINWNRDDSICVYIKNRGIGSGCPIYTDTARVFYQGRLIPSTSYSEGYIFDKSSYSDEFDVATSIPAKMGVSALVEGFATALQNMHIGDRWVVYIPYKLGYGSSSTTSVPAYSTMIFDMQLAAYYHVGIVVPDWE